ncbi:MAG: hypothetical protein ACE5GW_14090, partial [Planctomycetota bacterium]
ALIEGLAKPARGDLEEMGRAAEMPGVDPELVERFEAFRHRKPFLDVFEHYRERYHSAADAEGRVRARRDALEATHRLHKEGLVIADAKDELCHPFWILAFDGAVAAGDRAAAKDALGHYERAFTESTEQIGKMTEKLAEMGS